MAFFERNKNIKVDPLGDGLLRIEVSMMDNVHHITTIFHISFPERVIKHAEGEFRRAPYVKVCGQTVQRMKNLIGINTNRGMGLTEAVIEAVGGKDGCPHLVDHTLEMAKTLIQFIDKSYNFPLGKYIEDAPLMRRKVLEVYPLIEDTCWAYKDGNAHLFTKDVKCGLQADLAV